MTPYYDDGKGIRIYLGDWRDVMLEVGKANVLLTDPPYGISYTSGSVGTSHWHGKMIPGDESTKERDDFLLCFARPALVFGSWKVAPPAGTRATLVWDKGGALGMGDLSLPWKPSFDLIYVLGSGFHGRRDGSVLQYPPVQSMAKNGRLHPHEKPVPLLQALLAKSPAGDVIDPFMGSGSTLLAAKAMGRCAVGIDKQEWCCEIAAKRLQQSVLPLEVSA